jgi:hypothetical protein
MQRYQDFHCTLRWNVLFFMVAGNPVITINLRELFPLSPHYQ